MRTVLAFPSDTQCGSALGLIPPGQWQLHDGGYHNPSVAQKILWQQWAESWKRVAELRKKSRLVVVFNGDAVQGDRLSPVQMVTNNREEQERIHEACMDWALQTAKFSTKKGDLLYYVRGTAAHVGSGGQSEERIARDLGAVPWIKPNRIDGKDGRYCWEDIVLDVGGVIFDVAHHLSVRPGQRVWTRESSLRSKIISIYFDHLDHGIAIPRYVIGAHNHKFTHAEYEGAQGKVEGFIIPCFQFHDEWSKKVAAGELSTIGMLIVIVEDDGSTQWECPRITISDKPVVKL